MDKKKVIELIKKGISYWNRSTYITSYEDDAKECFNEAIKELSKSDWISVDKELPPYDEEVLVCDINATGAWGKPWICYRSKDECYRYTTDKRKFVTTRLGEITHWRRIEKLEE